MSGVLTPSIAFNERQRDSALPFAPRLCSIGLAVPPLFRHQDEIADQLASIWKLKGAGLLRWKRIIEASEIQTRHSVQPPETVVHLTTHQRMQAYERLAPGLAIEAAERAMANAAISADEITDLIVVSCTGFSAPGIDVALAVELGMRQNVRRSTIGFMGCFGAISGLRAAFGACAAAQLEQSEPAVALVVCVELCSLHVRSDPEIQNQIASALFADGAAAAVVKSSPNHSPRSDLHARSCLQTIDARLTTGHSLLIAEGRDWMTWRIGDAGFTMTLTRDVPRVLRNRLAAFVTETSTKPPATFVVHPGGPGILDAVDEALQLQGNRGLPAAHHVLQRFGNMSSGTILFVLEEALQSACPLPAMLLAFGPGLTIESLLVQPCEPNDLKRAVQ